MIYEQIVVQYVFLHSKSQGLGYNRTTKAETLNIENDEKRIESVGRMGIINKGHKTTKRRGKISIMV